VGDTLMGVYQLADITTTFVVPLAIFVAAASFLGALGLCRGRGRRRVGS
jgi:hypothetical protein